MQENGNCHVNVNNDYDGILEIIKWIDYFYSSRKYNKKIEKNEFLINYDAEYKKNNFIELYKDNKKYNENINEREILEFMCDENSITEYKKEFGKKIFCGRGKIKSVSFGILCTQNENIESSKNVLDVDSSKKIAQSISDFEKEGLDILILANFRGFSGGKEEMINNILNHGSLIIEKLYECKTRVLIYIVPGGEMRGGSWVVFDKNINPLIKIIAHPRSEVGIIEPAGICKLKFKEKERREIFKVENLEYNDEKAIKLANDFCKLHDSCYRMYLNGMIDDLICLDELRKYVYDNLLT
ncbi:acetyl-coenzyme-A carboxylase [Gurleya vavrai]